jgi:hypothetical protein
VDCCCFRLLLSAVLACFGGWLWIVNAGNPTRATFEQVQEGMTREEVIRIVGGPPGDYTIDGADFWRCDDGLLVVWFDISGRAVQKEVEIIPRPPTPTERIRRWLGL